MSAAFALQSRLAALRRTPQWEHYERARGAVLRMRDLADDASPSAYWDEELAGFEYLLDASPLVIERLRQHTFHVTGLRHYEYRTGSESRRRALAAKLEALIAEAGGVDLLVPEAHALGGFGHDISGALYNLDTLKFLEALIALRRGGVLDGLRSPDDRRLVWEIGAGWGGFAYQLKCLCPDVTYVIADLPELFLFSGTYLPTVLEGCRVRYWAGEEPSVLFDGWQELDFIFVPAAALGAIRPPRLDLTLNMVSFQEMTADQVRAYVEQAWSADSAWLYSLNRERSTYNLELRSASELVASRFDIQEIPVLDVPYTQMLHEGPRLPRAQAALRCMLRAVSDGRLPRPVNTYRHLLGRRRTVGSS
jgi:putative sugar O-methyltransferase